MPSAGDCRSQQYVRWPHPAACNRVRLLTLGSVLPRLYRQLLGGSWWRRTHLCTPALHYAAAPCSQLYVTSTTLLPTASFPLTHWLGITDNNLGRRGVRHLSAAIAKLASLMSLDLSCALVDWVA